MTDRVFYGRFLTVFPEVGIVSGTVARKGVSPGKMRVQSDQWTAESPMETATREMSSKAVT